MNANGAPAMELDDLKSAWQLLEQRLERQSRLQLQLLQDRKLDRVRGRLRRVYWGKIVQFLFGDLLLLAGIMATIRHHAEPHLLACSLFLLAYGLLLIVLGGLTLARVDRVDYDAPVLEIQERIGRLQQAEVVYGICAGLPWWLLWLAIFILEMKAWAGVDLWLAAPAFVWVSIAIGLAGLLVSMRLYRRSQAAPQSRLGRWFERHVGARSLREARDALAEVRRFED